MLTDNVYAFGKFSVAANGVFTYTFFGGLLFCCWVYTRQAILAWWFTGSEFALLVSKPLKLFGGFITLA